jgi:allophanate hydrolase subunit 1
MGDWERLEGWICLGCGMVEGMAYVVGEDEGIRGPRRSKSILLLLF